MFDSLCSNMKWTSCTRWRTSLPSAPMNSKCGRVCGCQARGGPRLLFVCLALSLPEMCSHSACDAAGSLSAHYSIMHPLLSNRTLRLLVCLSALSSTLPSSLSTPCCYLQLKLSLVQKLLLYYQPPPGVVAGKQLSG